MSGAAPLWRRIVAQARMELALTLRRGETLLVTLGIPLVLLLFFGSVPLVGAEGRRAEYLVPGILALAVMSTGMVALGIGTAFERHYGVLKRLGGSPLPRGGLLVAKVAAVLLVEVLQAGLVVGLAIVALAWRPTGHPALAVLVLLVGTATFCGLGLLMAGALRAEATLAVANGLYLVFLLLGDMVVPTALLPGWLAAVAGLLPATAFASALRAALSSSEAFPLASLAILLAWGVGSLAVAARTFRWE